MSYSRKSLVAVREKLAARRSRAITDFENRRLEIVSEIPELLGIEMKLSQTGTRIMTAALSHELDDKKLEELKNENEELLRRKADLLRAHGKDVDSLNIKYTCPKCGDTGYVGVDMCECMKHELIRAEFESSGLSSLLETQSFDSFSTDYYTGADKARIETNLRLLREYAESFTGKGDDSWLLLGATGLGKTHLSTSVAKAVIEKGHSVVYESAQGLISAFEAKRFGGDYESNGEERFYEAELLIIDDLGVEVANQFTVSCIYNVINTRICGRMPTIINTNLTQGELRERYADRITSRLFGEFRPLVFTGRDVRGQKIASR